MRRPPVVATWLLLSLATHRSNDALAGDLMEEFQRRPSRLWFWRQAFAAVLVSWWADVRAHRLLTLRAVAMGLSAIWLYSRYVLSPVAHVDEWLFRLGLIDHFVSWPHPVMGWMATMLGTCGAFWLVGRRHRPSMVVVLFVSLLLLVDVPRLVLGIYTAGPQATQGALFVLVIFRLPMLIAGLWAARSRPARHNPGLRTTSPV